MNGSYKNANREIWRKGDGDGNGMSYYEPHISVTEEGKISIVVGGNGYTLSVEEWHNMYTAWWGAHKLADLWRDKHADEHDRATRAALRLADVRALADKWAEHASWSQAGGEGTGGAHRPRMYWDAAADHVYRVLGDHSNLGTAYVSLESEIAAFTASVRTGTTHQPQKPRRVRKPAPIGETLGVMRCTKCNKKVSDPLRYDVGEGVAYDVPAGLVDVVWAQRPRWWQFWRWGENYADNWQYRLTTILKPATVDPDCRCGTSNNCCKHTDPYY